MDANEIDIKEVYALFGAAAYFAQCFERQLAITVSTVCITDSDVITREQYDALLSRNFSKTLGQLFHLMKSDITISDEIKDSIAEALRLRNFLMHNYFWERALSLNNTVGRQRMLQELSHACVLFQTIDSKVEALTREWGEKRGVTHKDYAKALKNLLEGE